MRYMQVLVIPSAARDLHCTGRVGGMKAYFVYMVTNKGRTTLRKSGSRLEGVLPKSLPGMIRGPAATLQG
jgi:hypothetical protein